MMTIGVLMPTQRWQDRGMALERGPYCSEDLGTWYVALEDCSYRLARERVNSTAELDRWQRLQYRGKTMAYLWDGDEHSHEDEETGDVAAACTREGCRYVMAWTFDVVER